MHAIILMENSAGINVCYYFDRKLCWHNYRTMLNKIIMTLECLVLNPLRKQMFQQDCIDLRRLIIIYGYERFFKLI